MIPPAQEPPLRLTVVVPLYNERLILPSLCSRLLAALESLPEWEVLFVDDGSDDGTTSELEARCNADERFHLLVLSRNFGWMSALKAGLDHAEGEAVVLMDGDLQDPPEAIPPMVRLWEQGAEVVTGVRVSRGPDWRGLTSWAFHRLFALLGAHRDEGTLCLLDRKVVLAIRGIQEKNPFLPGLRRWVGFRQASHPYHREPRQGGHSKQGLLRLTLYALDAIFGYSQAPLRLVFALSFGMGLLSLGCAVKGAFWAACLWGASALQVFSLALVGGYVARTFEAVRGRPSYLVRHRSR